MALCNMASPHWELAGAMSRKMILGKLCELDRSAHRWEHKGSSTYAASDAGGAFACGTVVWLWDHAGGISEDRYDMAAKAAYELAHWDDL